MATKKQTPSLGAQAFERVLVEVGESSKPAYWAGWNRWSVVETRPPPEWTVSSVAAAYSELTKGFKPATVRLSFTIAKRVWKQCQVMGKLADEAPYPFRHLRIKMGGARANVPEWNVLQHDEVLKLELALKQHPMELAIFRALVLSGLRASELCALRWENLRVEGEHTSATFIGKGGKLAHVQMHPKVLEAAGQWYGKTGGPARVGPFIALDRGKGTPLTRQRLNHLIVRWTKRVVGHKVTPHGLRATYISRAIEQFGIEKASKLARHSDIKMTQRYGRWSLKATDVVEF